MARPAGAHRAARLLPATLLAAQLAGIAAPVNPSLAAERAERLLGLGGARIPVAAAPE